MINISYFSDKKNRKTAYNVLQQGDITVPKITSAVVKVEFHGNGNGALEVHPNQQENIYKFAVGQNLITIKMGGFISLVFMTSQECLICNYAQILQQGSTSQESQILYDFSDNNGHTYTLEISTFAADTEGSTIFVNDAGMSDIPMNEDLEAQIVLTLVSLV